MKTLYELIGTAFPNKLLYNIWLAVCFVGFCSTCQLYVEILKILAQR